MSTDAGERAHELLHRPMSKTVGRYLERHAAPETHTLRASGTWAHAVVVPLHRESVTFLAGLAGLRRAGPPLVIAVVNARADDPAPVHAAHRALLDALCTDTRRGDVHHIEGLDVLVVDRASPGRELPPKEGVGSARKIGLDVALALWSRGQVASPWLRTTDADAEVFAHGPAPDAPPTGAVAHVARYWHQPCGAPALDRATALYEVWLRYYVAALAWAGSPWAYPTIGSTLCVDARAYAAVRGVPRRLAGEDFHLLAKLAKLGPVVHDDWARVSLRSRASDRVPFGTGPGMARFATELREGRAVRFIAPTVFAELRTVLAALHRAATAPWGSDPWGPLAALPASVRDLLQRLGLARCVQTLARTPSTTLRRRRVHEWLDARRTLRLVHGLRDAGRPNVPWTQALADAPFTAVDTAPTGHDLDDLLVGIRHDLQARAPARAGLDPDGAPAISASVP